LFQLQSVHSKHWGGSNGKQDHELFHDYVKQFGRTYPSEHHFNYRLDVFKRNLRTIHEMNKKEGRAVFGINKFADLTEEEFREQYLSPLALQSPDKQDLHLKPFKQSAHLQARFPQLPVSFDWRYHDAVTDVKNQGPCYSYWAFSAVDAIESQWYLYGHPLTPLSTQQVLDCIVNSTVGCDGGDPVSVYEYLKRSQGIMSEAEYPYTGQKGQCGFDSAKSVAHIDGWAWVTRNQSEDFVRLALITEGPLSACVDAKTWQFYFGGTIQHWCGESLNHCILITAYGQEVNWLDETIDVWRLKNSWGEEFGEQGYVWVERGKNLCGISDFVTIPLI